MSYISEETEEVEETEVKPYEYFEQVYQKKIHHYYLSGYIDIPARYIKMIHGISTAGTDDTVMIHLNTEGGDLATGIQLINAMKYSDAHVICSLEGEAFSLGSLIFLAADEFLIHDNSTMMIHDFTGGVYGKSNEQISQLNATVKWFKTLATSYYIPFLTELELDDILKGGDLWLQTEDIRRRLTKMVKTIQKENKKDKTSK